MAKSFGKQIEVTELPDCDRCKMQGATQTGTVRFDTRITTLSTWGYLCQSHFTYEGTKGEITTKLKKVSK